MTEDIYIRDGGHSLSQSLLVSTDLRQEVFVIIDWFLLQISGYATPATGRSNDLFMESRK